MKKKIKQDRQVDKLIRRSALTLKNSTKCKLQTLDVIMEEFRRVVNIYISMFEDVEILPRRILKKVDTWLSARMQRKCGDQALRIIKSCRANEENKRRKDYKKVYKYFLKKNRQKKFLALHFHELNLKRKWHPVFKADVMEIDADIFEYIEMKNSFDLWIKLTCIGRKIKLMLPTDIHKHYKKYLKNGWKRMSGARLRKTNGIWYFDSFFEKAYNKKQGNKRLGLDQGINKLIATSEGELYGTELKAMLYKVIKKKHGSKAQTRLVNRIKDYIHSEIKQLPTNYDEYILEDLTGIQIGTTKRPINKITRKLESRWQLGTMHLALFNFCDLNGIQIRYIDPRNTSRTCPQCGYVDKRNRDEEIFECCNCGHTSDADINAAINILSKFYQERGINPDTVPDSKKSEDFIFL